MANTKTYKVTFKAELTQEDVRAMNKCFFDCINEGMGIYNLFDFEMEEIPKEKEDLSPDLKKFEEIYQHHEEYPDEENAEDKAKCDGYKDYCIVKGYSCWHYFYNED